MKIKDFCTLNPKVFQNFDDDLLVSFVPMANVSENGHINTNEVRKYVEVKKGFTYFENGDVLLAKITPCLENGKGAVARNLKNNIGFGSTEFHVLRPDNSKVLSEWLYYFTHWEIFRKNCENNMTGSAGQKRVSKSYLENYEVKLPDINIQKKTVNILDQINQNISLRTQQLEQLDLLIKSRFVEMFGTLNKPAKNYNKNILKNLCTKITDGKHGGCKLETGSNRYFVGAREIYNEEVHYDTAPEINSNEFEKDYKRCNLEIGDFLIVNTGATIGKSAIARDKRTTRTLLQKSVALLKVKKDCLNPIFLKYCYSINPQMYLVENGSAQPNLLLSRINNTEIFVPDLSEQTQFAAFVEEVEQNKTTIKQSLEWLNTLKSKLMQDYFG